MLYLLNNYASRLPSIQFFYDAYYWQFNEFSRWHTPVLFLRRYCSYFICFGNNLLALHRVTAVWEYSAHETFWKQTYYYWTSFVFGIVFWFSGQELLNSMKFAPLRYGEIIDYALISNNAFNFMDTTVVSAPVIGVTMTIGVFINGTAFVLWQKRKTQIPTKYQDYEYKLIWLTGVIYLTGSLAVSFFTKYFNNNDLVLLLLRQQVHIESNSATLDVCAGF